jgi:hypothetical protein
MSATSAEYQAQIGRKVRVARTGSAAVVVAIAASSALARHAPGDREVVDIRVRAELGVELLCATDVDELVDL